MINNAILIDCDEVLSDFVGEVLRMARLAGIMATRDDVIGWDIGKTIGWDRWREAVSEAVRFRELAWRMPEVPGGIAWLRDVEQTFGADRVIIATNPWNPEWAAQRAAWLEARGVPMKRQMQGAAKQLLKGHLIDDSLTNCAGRQPGDAFLISAPWNKAGIDGVPRGDHAAALQWLKEVAT